MGHTKISNAYLTDIRWDNACAKNFTLTGNAVDIFRINVSSNLPSLNYFVSLIQPDEVKRANLFLREKEKNRFIIGRGALRYILAKYLKSETALIEFGTGVNKKPFIALPEQTGLHFNVSHSEDWIVLAISKSAIGVDVEFINESFEYDEVMDKILSQEEMDYVKQQNSIERFFLLWTRKEALIKFTGKGLDDDLKLIPALEGPCTVKSGIISSDKDLAVNSFKIEGAYIASIATGFGQQKFNFMDIIFVE